MREKIIISSLHCFFANVTPCPLVLLSSLTKSRTVRHAGFLKMLAQQKYAYAVITSAAFVRKPGGTTTLSLCFRPLEFIVMESIVEVVIQKSHPTLLCALKIPTRLSRSSRSDYTFKYPTFKAAHTDDCARWFD